MEVEEREQEDDKNKAFTQKDIPLEFPRRPFRSPAERVAQALFKAGVGGGKVFVKDYRDLGQPAYLEGLARFVLTNFTTRDAQ